MEKMDIDELEELIKDENKKLRELEEAYEREEGENKLNKLEYKISRKEEQIDKLIERQNALLDKEAKTGVEGKDEKAEEKDEDVCSECGGDLMYVETTDEGDIYECVRCHELYLDN